MIIELTEREVRKCFRFANRQLETSADAYSRRGQSNPDAIVNQIAEGKVAELAVWEWLNSHYKYPVTKPNFEVYDKGKKSFAADLRSDHHDFHIKTQRESAGIEYGVSWIFQRNDALVVAPTDRDVIVFTTVSDDLTRVNIRAVLGATTVVGLYGKLKISHLNRTKCAMYLDTLKAHGHAA